MRALAKRLGGHAVWLDDGTLEYDCALPETLSTRGASELDRARETGARSAPDSVPPRTAGTIAPVWTTGWERVTGVSIAFFETAALLWYDHASRIERRLP